MFNEINEGGLNRILSQRLGMQGAAAAPGVAPELFPTLTLENDRPEWGYLKGELLASAYVFRGAVAGQTSMAQLYLPATSNSILVVEKMMFHGTQDMRWARGVGISAGLAGWAAQNTATRDFRWPAQRTQGIIEINANAVAPSVNHTLGISTIAQVIDVAIVITPGTSLVLFTGAVNNSVNATLMWRERVALPGELV